MGTLDGEVAVVTGAGSGIGRAVATMLGAEGASVTVSARTKGDVSKVTEDIEALGSKAIAVPADVRIDEGIERLYEATRNALGTVSILVSNAGIGLYAPLSETTVERFDDIIATNVRGTYALVKRFLPDMVEAGTGHVIIIASIAGLHGFAGETAYCASKFAQVGFAEALDNEVREHGIKVSLICPGGVKTNFAFGAGRTPGDPMLDRFMTPEDVSEAVKLVLKMGDTARVLNVAMRSMIEPVA